MAEISWRSFMLQRARFGGGARAAYAHVSALPLARTRLRGAAPPPPVPCWPTTHPPHLLAQVDRKLVKQTVMTSVYGVTPIGAREQIEARLREKGWDEADRCASTPPPPCPVSPQYLPSSPACWAAGGCVQAPSPLVCTGAKSLPVAVCALCRDALWAASKYLADATIDAIGLMFQNAKVIMGWLAGGRRRHLPCLLQWPPAARGHQQRRTAAMATLLAAALPSLLCACDEVHDTHQPSPAPQQLITEFTPQAAHPAAPWCPPQTARRLCPRSTACTTRTAGACWSAGRGGPCSGPTRWACPSCSPTTTPSPWRCTR